MNTVMNPVGRTATRRLTPSRCLTGFPARWLAPALVATLCGTGTDTTAAPYPEGGIVTTFVQPSGAQIELRVTGDEFYARTTRDGYRVTFSEAKNAYFYLQPGPEGKTPVVSEIPAEQPPPQVPKDLPDPPEMVEAVRANNVLMYAPDRTARWQARVKAVQMMRTVGPAPAPSPAPGPAPTAEALEIAAAAAPVTGGKVGLMILVQFPDDPATPGNDPVSFPVSRDKIVNLCNKAGYNDDGNSGSVRDYFFDQSGGKLTHTQLVSSIITLDQPRNYYNFDDYPANTILRDAGETGQILVAEAVAKMKAAGFDFTTLAADGSGNVLATSLLFAGRDSGVWPKGLWPHAFSVPPINVGIPGKPRKVRAYQCTNVPNNAPVIGTIIHELGHLLLSYPDLYDTNSANGPSEGVGQHCLMGSGNHCNNGKTPAPINLYLKDFSGWASLTDLTPAQATDIALPTIGNQGVRLRKPGSSGEYFLVENRGKGDKWAGSVPDKGIMIWHIDEAITGNQNQHGTPGQHYEVAIEQADGAFDLEKHLNRGDANDLFDSSSQTFNNTSNPNSAWWSGAQSGISIRVTSPPGASMNVHFGP